MSEEKLITKNKKAYQMYEIVDTYEGGLVLLGTEVKSLRQGKVSIVDSYAHFSQGEVFLRNLHINPYDHGGHINHEPRRERKILLHRREIRKLVGKVTEKGFTLVPLRLYFKDGRAKVLLGLVRGKKLADRRKEIKERDLKRDMEREFKERQYQ